MSLKRLTTNSATFALNKMVKKAKKECYQNISQSEITGNKIFWKTVSPLFGDKVKTNQKINLIEKKCFSNLE